MRRLRNPRRCILDREVRAGYEFLGCAFTIGIATDRTAYEYLLGIQSPETESTLLIRGIADFQRPLASNHPKCDAHCEWVVSTFPYAYGVHCYLACQV